MLRVSSFDPVEYYKRRGMRLQQFIWLFLIENESKSCARMGPFRLKYICSNCTAIWYCFNYIYPYESHPYDHCPRCNKLTFACYVSKYYKSNGNFHCSKLNSVYFVSDIRIQRRKILAQALEVIAQAFIRNTDFDRKLQ